MLLKNDEIRQICVSNKIPRIMTTNYIYIQKHQNQEPDNGSQVCYSNNFRKKFMSYISIYLWGKRPSYMNCIT